jgi:8-oxo-dGTP diphosphatase
VLLDVHRVLEFVGEPRGMEGQPLRWRQPTTLQAADFPAADRPIITALQLPDRYLITGEDAARPVEFLQRLENALRQGLSLVQLRAHALSDTAYRRLAENARELCRRHRARLLLNRPGQLSAWADGVHLTRHQLAACRGRPRVAGWVGASCHDLHELQLAERLGLDYALLSPVRPTASHPNATPLGWQRFARWADQVNLPIYALGGVGLESLGRAKQAGAQGIAGISAFWGNQEPPKP